VLGGLADVERDVIRTRTGEGRGREGPWAAHRPSAEAHAAGRSAAGTEGATLEELAKSYKVDVATIFTLEKHRPFEHDEVFDRPLGCAPSAQPDPTLGIENE
jgi:hypothetical protein